jgi:hypothetical protein
MKKRELPPIYSNTGGHERIDFGIYSHKSWVLGPSFNCEETVGPDEAIELFKADRKRRKFDELATTEQLRRLTSMVRELRGDDEQSLIAQMILKLLRDFLARDPSKRDAEIFAGGARIGRLMEKFLVLPHQAAALRGKRHEERRRKNVKTQHDAGQVQNEKRRNAVYAEMERQKRNHERLSLRRAMKAAAVKCQCSFEAVKKAKPVNRWTARKKEK